MLGFCAILKRKRSFFLTIRFLKIFFFLGCFILFLFGSQANGLEDLYRSCAQFYSILSRHIILSSLIAVSFKGEQLVTFFAFGKLNLELKSADKTNEPSTPVFVLPVSFCLNSLLNAG